MDESGTYLNPEVLVLFPKEGNPYMAFALAGLARYYGMRLINRVGKPWELTYYSNVYQVLATALARAYEFQERSHIRPIWLVVLQEVEEELLRLQVHARSIEPMFALEATLIYSGALAAVGCISGSIITSTNGVLPTTANS